MLPTPAASAAPAAGAGAMATAGAGSNAEKKKKTLLRKTTTAGSKAVSAAVSSSGAAGAAAKLEDVAAADASTNTYNQAQNGTTAATAAAAADFGAAFAAAHAAAAASAFTTLPTAVSARSRLATPANLPSSSHPRRHANCLGAEFMRIKLPPDHTIHSLQSTLRLTTVDELGNRREFFLECKGDSQSGPLVFTKSYRQMEMSNEEPAPAAAAAPSTGAPPLLPPAPIFNRSKSDSTHCGRCDALQQLPIQPPMVEALLRGDAKAPFPAGATQAASSRSGATSAATAATAAPSPPKSSLPTLLVRVTSLPYVSPIKDQLFPVRIVSAPDPAVPERVTAWAGLMDVMQLVLRPFGSNIGSQELTWLDAAIHPSLQSRVDKLAPSHTVRATADSTHNIDWRTRLIRAEGLEQMLKTPQAKKLAKHESKFKGLTAFISDTLANTLRVLTYGPPMQQGAGAVHASVSSPIAAADAATTTSSSKPSRSKPKSKSPPPPPKRKGRPRKNAVSDDDSSDSSEGEQWAVHKILNKRTCGGTVQYQVHWLQKDGTPFSESDPTGITWEPAVGVKHMAQVKQWEALHATQKRYAKEKAIAVAAATAAAAAAAGAAAAPPPVGMQTAPARAAAATSAAAAAASAPATAADAPKAPADQPVKARKSHKSRPPVTAPNVPVPAASTPVVAAASSAALIAVPSSPKPITCLPPASVFREVHSSSVTSTSTTPRPSSAEPMRTSTAVSEPAAAAGSMTIVKPSPSKPKPVKRKIDSVDPGAAAIEVKKMPTAPAAASPAAAPAAAAASASVAAAASPAEVAVPPASPAAPDSVVKKRVVKKLSQPIGTPTKESSSSKAVPPEAKRRKHHDKAATKATSAGRDSIDLTD